MARPLKTGIDYFPLDCNFMKDIKVRRILRSCGPSSISVLICLLCIIYQDEGYYIEWGENAGFLVADEIGVKESFVHEVVKISVNVGFFHEELFNKYSILTSEGIQKRYKEATWRRVDNSININYKLINDDINEVNVDNNQVNDDRSTQSKVDKSKVDKTILDDDHHMKRCVQKLDEIIGKSASTEKFLSYFDEEDLDKVLVEIQKSRWLQNKLDRDRVPTKSFMMKILNGDYRNNYGNTASNAREGNGRTSNYSADELEEVARRKREEARESIKNGV